MRLRKPLMLLVLASLLASCDKAPRMPDIKECGPIVAYSEDGTPDWENSYAFCVLRKDPYNETHYERIPIHQFLLDKPRMMKASDGIKLDIYERELIRWGKKYCGSK